jgi:peptidoglycan/xylan/chitin deacetylase (PgdA/CDA1 family)
MATNQLMNALKTRRQRTEGGCNPKDSLSASQFGPNWRRALASGLYHSGLLRTIRYVSRNYEVQLTDHPSWPRLRRAMAPKFLILCYHRVGSGGVPLYSELAPERFEAQMRFVKKNYPIVSLEEVCRGLEEPGRADSGVAITFDDGYRDVFTYAFPILRKYDIPATVYLIADAMETGQVAWYDRIFLTFQVLPSGRLELELDRLRSFDLTSVQRRFRAALEVVTCLRTLPNQHRKQCCADLERRVKLPQDELAGRILSWDQVQAMQRAGISFGSHTVSHPAVSQLTRAEMETELAGSKRFLEGKLGRAVQDFAFPFGHLADCGTQAAAALARFGYRSAVTTVPGVNSPGEDLFALRRVQIYEEHNPPMFAFSLSQFFLLSDSARPEGNSKINHSQGPSQPDNQSKVVEGMRNA